MGNWHMITVCSKCYRMVAAVARLVQPEPVNCVTEIGLLTCEVCGATSRTSVAISIELEP